MRGSANTTERTDGRHGLAYDMAWGMEYGKGGYGKGHMKRMLFGQIRCSALHCSAMQSQVVILISVRRRSCRVPCYRYAVRTVNVRVATRSAKQSKATHSAAPAPARRHRTREWKRASRVGVCERRAYGRKVGRASASARVTRPLTSDHRLPSPSPLLRCPLRNQPHVCQLVTLVHCGCGGAARRVASRRVSVD